MTTFENIEKQIYEISEASKWLGQMAQIRFNYEDDSQWTQDDRKRNADSIANLRERIDNIIDNIIHDISHAVCISCYRELKVAEKEPYNMPTDWTPIFDMNPEEFRQYNFDMGREHGE